MKLESKQSQWMKKISTSWRLRVGKTDFDRQGQNRISRAVIMSGTSVVVVTHTFTSDKTYKVLSLRKVWHSLALKEH